MSTTGAGTPQATVLSQRWEASSVRAAETEVVCVGPHIGIETFFTTTVEIENIP